MLDLLRVGRVTRELPTSFLFMLFTCLNLGCYRAKLILFYTMKKFSFLYLIPVLLMLAAPFQTSADDFVRGDCNEDGNVTIADVTTLIDYLLTDLWPGEVDPTQPTDGDLFTYYVNSVPFNMVYVEGGTFWMGATDEQAGDYDSDETPVNRVHLSSYYIGQTEVTQELWREVMGTNPSNFLGDLQRPVEMVSWNDCQTFISRLNELTGMNFRLLTEAEWEFAARGGNKSQGYKYAGSNTIGDVAWYSSNASSKTHPVATKAPNELGLYDMSGNVSELVNDWYGSYTSGEKTNPTGPATGSSRVTRGSGWSYGASKCRVSSRNRSNPSSTYYAMGLRLAL